MAAQKILVTGAEGWIGGYLVPKLRQKYGNDNVIAMDNRRNPNAIPIGEPFVLADITDFNTLEQVVKDNGITWVFHMAAILSMGCELDPPLAMKVNILGFQNMIELARIYNLRIFSASSIAAFGPSTPKELTPDVTIQRPPMLYGCTKVHNELIGEFYHRKWAVDFRSIRYPVVVAHGGDGRKSIVGFAPMMFQEAVKTGHCTVDVAEYTRLPYCYIEDTVDATIKLMEAAPEKLTLRTYNLMGFSASVREIVSEIQKHVPAFKVDYVISEAKQPLVDALIDSVDDSNAKRDWDWNPKFDFSSMVKVMIELQKSH